MSAPAMDRAGTDALRPPPALRRRRSPRVLLLGAVLVAVGAALGWSAFQAAGGSEPVVALARPLAFGQTITQADLREVALARGSGIAAVPWREVDRVVGRTAGTDLYPNQVLPPEAVRDQQTPAAGEAVIGIPVGPGQLPTTPLRPRDEVLVTSADAAAPPVLAAVLDSGRPDATGRRTVDLLVEDGSLPGLIRAAGDDRTILVLVGRR